MAQPQEQKTHQQPHNLPFLLDTLYCEESHWEEEVREEGFLEEEEEESYYGDGSKPNAPPLLEPDLLCEDEELVSLFSKEEKNDLHSNPESNPLAAGARSEAVEWMLRVNAHYSFSALTAVLAVNYFDRFLFSCDVQGEKPWMTQLAAVACLSLAAKVEETQVPLLLDLQVCLIQPYLDFLEMLPFRRPCFLYQHWIFPFNNLFRWRRRCMCSRQRPFRGWRLWCSPRFDGRWTLWPRFHFLIILRGGLDWKIISVGNFSRGVSASFSLFFLVSRQSLSLRTLTNNALFGKKNFNPSPVGCHMVHFCVPLIKIVGSGVIFLL